jgi:hypothetical protein
MEGLNYLCLGIVSCVGSLVGAGTVLAIFVAIVRPLISRRFGQRNAWIAVAAGIALSVLVPIAVYRFYLAPAFPGYYMPRQRPNEQDILGTWVARQDSLDWMEELGYAESHPTLTLNEAGEFAASHFPDVLFFRHDRVTYQGGGSWRLVQGIQRDWQVELTFAWIDPPWYPDPPLSGPTPCPGSSVPCEGLRYTFPMWNRQPPYVLISYAGGELGPSVYYIRLGDTHKLR